VINEILTHERLKASIGDAIAKVPADQPFTDRAIAKRSSHHESVVGIMMKQFLLRDWIRLGPMTDDGRQSYQQSLKARRGWETYREALRDVVEGSNKVIDPDEELRIRLAQQGLPGKWVK
jgi:hypothetical protein